MPWRFRIRGSARRRRKQRDKAHARFDHINSDFLSYLEIWNAMAEFRKPEGGYWRSKMKKFCQRSFLNMRRMME